MSPPSTHELKDVIVDILSAARDDDLLSQLTVRIVRQKLATHFDLEEDVLNTGDYKSFIKATVHTTMDSLRSATDEAAELSRREASENKKDKEKAGGAVKTGARKPKAKTRVHSEEEAASECDAPRPTKKATARSKPSKPTKSTEASRKPESDMKYKSKAIIESSGDEAAEPGAHKSARSPTKDRPSTKSSPPKRTQQQKAKKHGSDVEMDSVEGPSRSGPSPKSKPDTESPKTVLKGKELARDPMESELSSVIDEPPKKRQKKQEKDSAKAPTKPQKDEKTKRGKKEALSKDEETINKLKGIVVACGVRKVWKKEFEGLDKPSQQIKRLHSILGDLGMTPRYSIEKAKALREQRELAQELQDVQEFEKATKRRGKTLRSSSETDESADQEDSADVPARKKQNARASIMAFLQDQSEEE